MGGRIAVKRLIGNEMLRLFGLDVKVAHDGTLALPLLEQHRFDRVLMDIGMPVLDGHEATRQLHEREIRLKLPCVPVRRLRTPVRRPQTPSAGRKHLFAGRRHPFALSLSKRCWRTPGRASTSSARTDVRRGRASTSSARTGVRLGRASTGSARTDVRRGGASTGSARTGVGQGGASTSSARTGVSSSGGAAAASAARRKSGCR